MFLWTKAALMPPSFIRPTGITARYNWPSRRYETTRAGSRSWDRCHWTNRARADASRGWRQQTGMLGLRYSFLQDPARRWLADGTLDWLWAEAEKAEVPIAMIATDSLAEIARIAKRHPALRLTIAHLGGRGCATTLQGHAAMTHMPALLALAKYQNVAVNDWRARLFGRGVSVSGHANVCPSRLRCLWAAPHVLGNGHFRDALLMAPMCDDVHRGTIVARPG